MTLTLIGFSWQKNHMNRIIKAKLNNTYLKIILNTNYWLNNYKKVIWLIGDGRSGTTWVSNLINHDKKYRQMFEPFHPKLINEASFLLTHQYVRPNEANRQLEKFASDVFSGKFKHPSVDSDNHNCFHKGILIKDIFANLFAFWASNYFPKIKIILLIRNPFSVALSKFKKKNWFWAKDPMLLMNQNSLYEDYLYRFEDIIRETCNRKNYILNQILIWSIINYVPLKQFKFGQIYIEFYEEIYTKPNQTISNLFEKALGIHLLKLDEQVIKRPSKVAGDKSNILEGKSPVTSWKNELTVQQIDAGLNILEAFGLEKLYDDSSLPNRQALYEIFTNSCKRGT